jgi:cysteate synthase
MTLSLTPADYLLRSVATGATFPDENWLLDPPGEPAPSLLRTDYTNKKLDLLPAEYGIYRFAGWMPVKRILKGSSAPVTYKSAELARNLGLENLYITFSGYWPEKGALMRTCSFKETEAYSVCARLKEGGKKVLVVASAGNTARAFAQVCSENHIPLILAVPEDNLDALWFAGPLNDCVKVVASEKGSDYSDAISLSNEIAQIEGFVPEGGAKNVARRDGMATTVLSAVTHIGRIPDYYFQAVGSGTGAIAAWEANLRFLEDGRFGSNKMKLMLSQNFPFHPMYDAWKDRSRQLPYMDEEHARTRIEKIKAKVLSNRKPPYGITGGLFDAMVDTNGEMFLVRNEELHAASVLFEETESIDLHPAAAVATASLIHALQDGRVERDAVIMLNITGGGEELFKEDKELFHLRPSLVFPRNASFEQVREKVSGLFF